MKSKKVEIGKKLKAMASKVSQQMRMQWCIENGMGLTAVNSYFTGKVGNIIVGEKLLTDMAAIVGNRKNSVAA